MRIDPVVASTVATVLAVVVAVPVGGRVFAVAVVLFAFVAMGLLSVVLADVGHRPLLPAAAIAGAGFPLLVAWRPASGWELLPTAVAAMLLAAFTVAIAARRRRNVVSAIGATLLLGLVVGLGSGGWLLLRTAPRGARWSAAGLVLVLVPHVAAAVTRRFTPAQRGAADTARVVGAGAACGAVIAVAGTPLTLPVVTALAGLGLAASFSGALMARALRSDRPTSAVAPVELVIGVLVAAPLQYLVARAVVL